MLNPTLRSVLSVDLSQVVEDLSGVIKPFAMQSRRLPQKTTCAGKVGCYCKFSTVETGLVMNYPSPRTGQMPMFEVDCLLIWQFGVVLIEVKNWRGSITILPHEWVVEKQDTTTRHKSPIAQSEPKKRAIEQIIEASTSGLLVDSIVVLSHEHVTYPVNAPLSAMCPADVRFYFRTLYHAAASSAATTPTQINVVRDQIESKVDRGEDAKHRFLLQLAQRKIGALDYLELENRLQAIRAEPLPLFRSPWRRVYLGAPDHSEPNPHRRGAEPKRLFLVARVLTVESNHEEFKKQRERSGEYSLRLKEQGQKKRSRLESLVRAIPLPAFETPWSELERLAVDRLDACASSTRPVSRERVAVDILIDTMKSLDWHLDEFLWHSGIREARKLLRRRMLAHVIDHYPMLADAARERAAHENGSMDEW